MKASKTRAPLQFLSRAIKDILSGRLTSGGEPVETPNLIHELILLTLQGEDGQFSEIPDVSTRSDPRRTLDFRLSAQTVQKLKV